jgi:hypothetical protein
VAQVPTREATSFLVSLALSASLILPGSARAESASTRPAAGTFVSSPIGKIVTTTGSVTVERTNAVLVQAGLPGNAGIGEAKVGDLVYNGDVVQTGPGGKVGITFADGSAFNLSSNARMVLNELVYEPNGKSNSLLFSLSKGAFTFIAGKVAKTGNMEIDTPVATMGIRGTTPRVEIRDDGSVAFSTLIEENKRRATERRGAIDDRRVMPVRQRQGQRASPANPSSAQATESRPDARGIKLNICRGC